MTNDTGTRHDSLLAAALALFIGLFPPMAGCADDAGYTRTSVASFSDAGTKTPGEDMGYLVDIVPQDAVQAVTTDRDFDPPSGCAYLETLGEFIPGSTECWESQWFELSPAQAAEVAQCAHLPSLPEGQCFEFAQVGAKILELANGPEDTCTYQVYWNHPECND